MIPKFQYILEPYCFLIGPSIILHIFAKRVTCGKKTRHLIFKTIYKLKASKCYQNICIIESICFNFDKSMSICANHLCEPPVFGYQMWFCIRSVFKKICSTHILHNVRVKISLYKILYFHYNNNRKLLKFV